MREILFRGKSVYNEEWYFGDLLTHEDATPDITEIRDFKNRRQSPVFPETIGQYTGLIDKNGKKIFEGDIIQMNNNQKDIAQVCFGEFGCVDIESEEATDVVLGWYYKPISTDALSKLEPFCLPFQLNKIWIEVLSIAVIGNIHDNPELLKVPADG